MIIISHRGNLDGIDQITENSPAQIEKVIKETDFRVEVDLWISNKEIALGHDYPEYPVDQFWLEKHAPYLVIHAKDLKTASELASQDKKFNWFYHTDEDMVQTSWGWLWTYPGVYITNGIVVELGPPSKAIILNTRGVCTDYPLAWKKIQ